MINDRIPYTYLIGWAILDKYYYGVRYAKKCNPDDLWVTYFTSSNKVKEFAKMHGAPDVIQVRKVFQSIDESREWEKRVLTKLNVLQSDKWLNSNVGGAMPPWIGESNPMYGRSRKGEVHNNGEHISKGLREFFETELGKLERQKRSSRVSGESNPMYGKTHSEEYKQFMSNRMSGESNPMYGKTHSEDARKKISESRRGKPSPMKGKPSKMKGVPKGPMKETSREKLRKKYLINNSIIVTNAKEWCAMNGYKYVAFTQAAKYNKPYKGMTISVMV